MGSLVRAARLAQQMTQDDVASRSGLSRPQIANIEGGRCDVPTKTLMALAKALNCQPGELLPSDAALTERAEP
jgi:transcriptional regulator with XRE-family HTH domain